MKKIKSLLIKFTLTQKSRRYFVTSLVINSVVAMFGFQPVISYAHDPSLHKKENAEKPNCVAFAKLDQSKMDPNDPVVQAMMKQCSETHHLQHDNERNEGQQGNHRPETKK